MEQRHHFFVQKKSHQVLHEWLKNAGGTGIGVYRPRTKHSKTWTNCQAFFKRKFRQLENVQR